MASFTLRKSPQNSKAPEDLFTPAFHDKLDYDSAIRDSHMEVRDDMADSGLDFNKL